MGKHRVATAPLRQQFGDGRREQAQYHRQAVFAMTIGQETEIADALKAWRKHVHQEAANEFAGIDRHNACFLLVLMPVILPAKCDLAFCDSDQAVIADGDTVAVSA